MHRIKNLTCLTITHATVYNPFIVKLSVMDKLQYLNVIVDFFCDFD